MSKAIKNVVILGGGTAGWITAGLIAKKLSPTNHETSITLIESKSIAAIGVGEGTWPTMRSTLKKIGISETDLITQCDATFKQASKFVDWVDASEQDFFYHPFNSTKAYPHINLAPYWHGKGSFSGSVSCQEALCEQGLAPKHLTTPEYQDIANYGYHLDAVKFAQLLRKHCVETLGVKHIEDDVLAVNKDEQGFIDSLSTRNNDNIAGDLFIDCSGFRSLLLGKAMQVPFISKQDTLFCDSALVVQVPYKNTDSPIPCYTQSTAKQAGWIWDIGLSSRRGVGYVYSSKHASDEQAEQSLRNYLSMESNNLEPRKISFEVGHREVFWKKNCVAVGLSAGFLEPLEASALMFVETSAAMIADQFPACSQVMEKTAARFNQAFLHRWNSVIDFLKLHYVLSNRPEPFWVDNKQPNSISKSLLSLLELWKYQAPSDYDFTSHFDLFRAPSYQYILYGMGYKTDFSAAKHLLNENQKAARAFDLKNKEQINLCATLVSHRELISKVKQHGFSRI
jgi:2-polyprenyl-6-methoxyphenol hydroxylase-like FAD-dependent oxidoreductase